MTTDRADELLQEMSDLFTPRELGTMLEFVGHRVGAKAEEIAGAYPPKRTGVPLPQFYTLDGKPSKFKSRKQRAYVMMLAAQGKIPYSRSGRLGASLTHTVELTNNGVDIHVGTNRPGAEYVIGSTEQQNHYLASLGWESLSQKIDDHMNEIDDVIESSLDSYLKGYLSK